MMVGREGAWLTRCRLYLHTASGQSCLEVVSQNIATLVQKFARTSSALPSGFSKLFCLQDCQIHRLNDRIQRDLATGLKQ